MSTGLYETPQAVAELLASWAPSRIQSLLEPAVGNGALLEPMLKRLKRNSSRVVCVDVDQSALEEVRSGIGTQIGDNLRLIDGDFLGLPREQILDGQDSEFDCIIMNPPFAGKVRRRVYDDLKQINRFVPIEVAFVVKVLDLLATDGVILAILPSSVISSSQGQWIRECLLSRGSIAYVHELPRNTFDTVDAKAYAMVFRKGRVGKRIMLCNHSVYDPERLVMRANGLGQDRRLDYSFQRARLMLKDIREISPEGRWVELGSLADIVRGNEDSPAGCKRALHSTDCKEGLWDCSRLAAEEEGACSQRAARANDILMVRVGRRCHESIGLLDAVGHFPLTDCVLRIRLRSELDSVQLLFALRTVLSSDLGRDLVSRGNAATYVLPEDLKTMSVPLNLASMYPGLYSLYKRAVQGRKVSAMKTLERCVQGRLTRKLSKTTENRCLAPGEPGEAWEGRKEHAVDRT